MSKTELEEQFLEIVRAQSLNHMIRIPYPDRQYRFHKTRKWRFDFAWPQLMVAVEIEGGVFTGGRHVTGIGITKDCDKYNTAIASGWKVLRFTASHLRDPYSVFELILIAMEAIDPEAA